jgi:MFS family permease
MLCGVALFVLCAVIALSGVHLAQFWAALMLLGIGWNFLFIGSTALLTQTYKPAERAKTQAANDFLIFGTVAVSAFSSGVLLAGYGWAMLAFLVLPLAAIILGFLLFYRRHRLGALPVLSRQHP